MPTGHESEPQLRSHPSQVEEDSDFGDSFLQEVAQVPVMPRRPVAGERLGGRDGRRFEVLEELGVGGMGWVLRAWDEQLQRVVALKFLVPRAEQVTDLALREARAIARLDHENIVRIFDVAEWSAPLGAARIPFLVMECLKGESLASLLRRERPGLRRTLEIMRGVVAGLAHAHEHHVVHRDLKPSNVFINDKGVVKLLDFGLAWRIAADPSSAPPLPTAGTPPYMAPEQWRGDVLDERTDIWAVGVMLYEMLTGELPYPSPSLEELRAQVLSAEPAPLLRAHHPELPWELESLVAVALAKEPAKRQLSAAELQEELRELEEHLRPGREPPRAPVPQRRQVTLVSCTLEGLTEAVEALDPEDFGELEASFHRCFSRLIQRHGGFVTLCMGSEALACFGYPVAHEGDSERAVDAGLLLDRSIREALQARLPGGLPPSLEVKVGIHTGMVVLDDVPLEMRGHLPSIQGEAPKVAAWLAHQADPGEVMLSREAYLLVRRAFDTRPLGPRVFEGSRRVLVYRVLGARQRVSRFEQGAAVGETLSPLVGRKRELDALLSLWREARQGRGAFALICGEAGIGKSRLIQELHERIPPEQGLRLRLQCWSQFSSSAFNPVIELLQRSVLSPERSPHENLHVWEEWLAMWQLKPVQVPLLASLLSLPAAEASPHLRLTPERQMEEVLDALGTLLLRASALHPVLLVVEDLHWADPSTLKLLGSLRGRVEGARVLVVLSARPEFRLPWPGSGFHVLQLERLSAECTARLAEAMTRGRTLPRAVLAGLVARTDGVPLFVEEMSRMLLQGEGAASIPTTLQELLLARLDTLPRRHKELAQVCAVLGRSFTLELLSSLTGSGSASLRRDLAGLVNAGLLRRQEEATGLAYQFRHALIQEAAYQSLPRSARRQHHRNIARTLVEHFPGRVENRPELLAHHYTEAGELLPAIEAWKRAGLRAALRYANEEAVSHLTQALRLLRSLPDAASRAPEELQLLMSLGLPLVQVEGYRSPDVERTYTRVRELFHSVGDDALSRLELPYWGAFAYFFTQKKFREAHEVGELLVHLGQRRHEAEFLSVGHRMMATDFFNWGDMPRALEHIEQAQVHSGRGLSVARQRALAVKHSINPRAMALSFGSVIHSAVDALDVARAQALEAVALAGKLGHAHTVASVLTYAAIGGQLRRDARSTLEWANQCIELSSEQRFRLWWWWSMIVKSWAMAWLGQPEAGLTLMHTALPEWEQSGFRTGTPHNLGMLADIYLRLGRIEEGLAAVDRALAPENFLTGERGWEADLHLIRGQLLRSRGQEEQAREEFLQGLHIAQQQGAHLFARSAQAWLRRQAQELGTLPESLTSPS